ncbi:MAG TPA: DUF302 domain-containing protein [Steroidobacteraceae bacterium]|jgi:uncharacterized protein (DUF302 family)
MNPAGPSPSGVVDLRSPRSVVQTIDHLNALATQRGLTVFARIDFSGDAQRAGLTMRPMQMLIFGNPKAGTPILQAAPRSGLDLPLKALAWEDGAGVVWLSYNAPDYLAARHDIPQPLLANIAGIRVLAEAAVVP